MVFFVLFSLFTTLSFLALRNPSKYLHHYIIALIISPSSASLSILNVKEGVYFYDGIIISAVLLIASHKKKLKIRLNFLTFASLLIFTSYFLVAILNVSNIIYLIKELRPLLLLVTAISVSELLKSSNFVFTKSTIQKIAKLAFFSLILKIPIQSFVIGFNQDEFYVNNLYRYLDASTYICACLLIGFTNKSLVSKGQGLTIILLISVVLASNSRFILLSLLTIFVINNLGSIRKITTMIPLSLISISSFILYSFYTGADRIMNALTYTGIKTQLMSRYLPAIYKLKEFEIINYLIGDGLGKPFFIPWFSYRSDMDPYNINIDSFYLTYFCKFGLLSIPLFIVFSRFFSPHIKANMMNINLFLVIMFFVSSTPYHIYAIGVLFGFIIMQNYERNS